MLFISFCKAVRSKAVKSKAVGSKAVSSEAVGFIDKRFVHKQVVVKLHDQLIVIRDYIYIYQLNLIVVHLKILKYNGRRRRSCT